MKRHYLALGLVLLLAAATPVFAQTDLTLDSVQVQFWPEFDDPGMLVIYTIELAEDTPLPAVVSLRIPTAAGEPNAVAVSVDDNLLTAEYTREVTGDWAEIAVNADSLIVHVEYYDPGLTVDGDQRSFNYTWPGDYAVNQFIVRVQEPNGATGITFSEAMGNPQSSSDGLRYYTMDFGALAAGAQFEFSISYNKSDRSLTVDALAGESSTSSVSGTPWWLWLLVGMGVVLIAMGGLFFFKDSSKKTKSSQSKYARKRSRAAGRSGGSAEEIFCHNCGAKAQPGDNFCRECGQKLRV
jgi:hypothetical protein